jgi:ferredoxin
MRVRIDRDWCASSGQCVFLAPEVFRIGVDGISEVIEQRPEAGLHGRVREAAMQCPMQAVEIVESGEDEG